MFGTLRKTNNSANLYGTDNKKKLETIQPASLRTPAMPKKNAAEIGGDTSIFGKKLAGLKSRRPKEFAEAITQTDEEITHFAEEYLTKEEDKKPQVSLLTNKPVATYADKVKELVQLEKKVERMETCKKLNKEMADDLDELDELMALLRNSKTISMAKDTGIVWVI